MDIFWRHLFCLLQSLLSDVYYLMSFKTPYVKSYIQSIAASVVSEFFFFQNYIQKSFLVEKT